MDARSEAKKVRQLINYKIKSWLEQNRRHLEERRDKLFTLLQEEEEGFKEEIQDEFKNRKANHLDEMRKRVAQLKAARQLQHDEFVKHKLDECFTNQCEEMRSLMSKKIAREISKDWAAQIEMKKRLECETKEEQLYWTKLNYLDMMEKDWREEEFEKQRFQMAMERKQNLKEHVKRSQLKKAYEGWVKQKERHIMEEDLRLIQQDREARAKLRLGGFSNYHDAMEQEISMRDSFRDRRNNVERDAGDAFLKKTLREISQQTDDTEKIKRDKMKAIQIYLDYERKRGGLQKSTEESVQHIQNAIIEEQYQKAMAFKLYDRKQRQLLHQNVMEGRAKQVEANLVKQGLSSAEKLKEIHCARHDAQQVLKEVEEFVENKQRTQDEYVNDLCMQNNYLQEQKDQVTNEIARERTLGEMEEKLFKHRVQTTLKQDQVSYANPMRHCVEKEPNNQCFHQV